jgi:hypothetical protein
MTKEQFNREALYQATLAMARVMLRTGCISPSELTKIDAAIKAKYAPILGGLNPGKP